MTKKYGLKVKSGEIVSTTVAENFEEAVQFFSFRKKFNKYVLLHLFDVVVIMN
jgi:hypothetical protein